MSVDRSRIAQQVSVESARQAQHPLNIFPGDGNLKLTDLPEVGDGYLERFPPDVYLVVESVGQSRLPAEVLNATKAGIIQKTFVPGSGIKVVLGLWQA